MSNGEKVIAARVPDDLVAKLKVKARQDDRTVAKTVVRILREYFYNKRKTNGRKET